MVVVIWNWTYHRKILIFLINICSTLNIQIKKVYYFQSLIWLFLINSYKLIQKKKAKVRWQALVKASSFFIIKRRCHWWRMIHEHINPIPIICYTKNTVEKSPPKIRAIISPTFDNKSCIKPKYTSHLSSRNPIRVICGCCHLKWTVHRMTWIFLINICNTLNIQIRFIIYNLQSDFFFFEKSTLIN